MEYLNQSLYTCERDKWKCKAAAIMVPDGLETPIFVIEIVQSSGKQSFDQLQSCSRQLEHLKIGFRKVWEIGWSGKLL